MYTWWLFLVDKVNCSSQFAYSMERFFTSRVSDAAEEIESVPSVCASVCLSVCLSVWLSVFQHSVCVSIHHGKKDFGAKELYNTGRGRCVNAQAFSLANSFRTTEGTV